MPRHTPLTSDPGSGVPGRRPAAPVAAAAVAVPGPAGGAPGGPL